MKKYLLFSVALSLVSYVLSAQTLGGTITNNTTLTSANSPYIVTSNLTVNDGVTLTVEPGVEVRFNNGVYLQVFGNLNASGATFTANESATAGAWVGIYVSYQSSSSVGNVELDNCIIEYARSLHVRKGNLTLTNNTLVKDFSDFGVDIYTAGHLDIDATTIQNCDYPVYFRDNGGNGSWSPGEGISLTGNSNDYIFIDFRDVNSEFRLYNKGIPYYFNSELRITNSGTMIIDPGVSLLGNNDAYINVDGKFKANGTQSEPVLFDKESSAAYWQGINFRDAAIDTACFLNYCNFKGAVYSYYNNRSYEISRSAVEVIKSSPVFENCEFSNNRYNLVVTGRSFPTFTTCNFMASDYVGKQTLNINMDLNAEPSFDNCTMEFNNNEGRAIGIMESLVYDDSHLQHHSFSGIDSITYTLHGDVTIQDTASLAIDPGIVIKSVDNNYDIIANGALTAVGTADNPIIFTYINDDEYGHPMDTYNDGTTSISSASSGRIYLNSQNTSTLENCKILYGGYSSSYYAVYVYNGNIIRDCLIRDSYRGILFSDDAQVLNNALENISDYPLARRMNDGAPVLIGNTLQNSGLLGIYVHDFLEGSYSISGLDIGSNTNVAYFIDNNMQIPSTASVTILPGTIFKFHHYYGKLSVKGGLKAVGTASNKIIFTSNYDNSAGGNTTFNNGSDPTGYKWDGIEFYDSSDDGFTTLKNCEVRYVDYGLKMTNCHVVVDSILLNFSGNHALEIYGSANPEITNSSFNNLNDAPIHMDMFANPSFEGNSVANVSMIGISINGGTISGTVPVRSFAGYDTITYLIFETLRVDDQLTIPAGLTFKGNGSSYFDIYGTLNVLGTAEHPVIFTALQDDEYGKPADTQLNGSNTIYKDGNRIVFRDLSDDNSLINHAIFRYSYDYAIQMDKASPVIKNCTFYSTNNSGLYLLGSSAPTVDTCTFEDLRYPVITSLMTFPGSYSGNVLSGSTARAIKIIDNETLTQNYTLSKKSFAGIENIPYLFDRYNVGTSAVLTIEPGVICKFMDGGYLNVRNGLIADGGATPDSAIIFTADRDDFYGGDTYADGDANLPDERWWNGIYFPSESIDASCFLDNCIIKNASYVNSTNPSSYNRGAITMDNASPTIQNTLFEENYWGILVRNTSLPVISNCDFVETNSANGYGVWNETGAVTVVAENCWWNDASGPYNATSNPDGLGERVSDNVDFDPWVSQVAKPIMGDVSLNGEVMPYDASLVLQHTVGNITLDAKQAAVADVSGNETVTSYDASLILQYSIGLITNFDQANKKSANGIESPDISVPAEVESSSGARFEIPLTLSTPYGIKSLDMQFSVDPQKLNFTGINSSDIPSDILVTTGYREDSGILRLSLTSAYDLDLALNDLILQFTLKDEQVSESIFEMQEFIANETEFRDELFSLVLTNTAGATGLPVEGSLSGINIYRAEEVLKADLDLAVPQSRLVINVYDMTGRQMTNLALENLASGSHQLSLPTDSRFDNNNLYLINIRGDDFNVTRKILLR